MRSLASEILIDAEKIRRRVRELAAEIERDTPENGEIAALIVLKGAFVFGSDLLREINRHVRIGFLESHRDVEHPGLADFAFTHPFRVEGSDLLIIEDILDTGHTMNHLLSRMRSRRPARLRTVVLLDKISRREVPVPVDYIGFQIPDKWVVGYGLDEEERFRNLQDIGYVE